MNELELLTWLSNGKRTPAQATKSGRDRDLTWDICLLNGLFKTQDGRLVLTEDGQSWLSLERSASG